MAALERQWVDAAPATARDKPLLAQQAFLAFKQLLFSGEIRAGQFISVSELVERCGLPLAPVREAVKHAESVGLVRILPKRGAVVLEPTPDTIRACFYLRCIMDQEGARVLAAQGRPHALAALRHEHVALRARAGISITRELQQDALDVDWKLHLALAEALDSDLAAHLYACNADRITVLQRSRHLLPERIVPIMDEHLEIIDAIASGEQDASMQAVRSHYTNTLRWWGIVPS